METYAAIAALIILALIGIGVWLAGPEKWMPGDDAVLRPPGN